MSDKARLLGERYELSEVLGRGGMAEVRLGRDVRLGRTVAVKTLRSDLALDSNFQARFRREAQSAASLSHPAIVSVYDTGEDYADGVPVPYIVMEYVDGQTLRELLNSGRKLLPERAMEIAAGTLSALEYSHQHGIVHRDIKPGNVMLTRAGTVKVMDFGIARAVSDASSTMTSTAAVIGTAQYLSPEQAKGEKTDARSDLYSTGCLLYELLTGVPPFVGDSPVAVAYQHVRESPKPPSQVDAAVTPAMDAIVLKALAKNADNRYQSAAEMRDDIERALDGKPVLAPTVMFEAPTEIRGGGGSPTARMPVAAGADESRRKWAGRAALLIGVIAVVLLGVFVSKSVFGGSSVNRAGRGSGGGRAEGDRRGERAEGGQPRSGGQLPELVGRHLRAGDLPGPIGAGERWQGHQGQPGDLAGRGQVRRSGSGGPADRPGQDRDHHCSPRRREDHEPELRPPEGGGPLERSEGGDEVGAGHPGRPGGLKTALRWSRYRTWSQFYNTAFAIVDPGRVQRAAAKPGDLRAAAPAGSVLQAGPRRRGTDACRVDRVDHRRRRAAQSGARASGDHHDAAAAAAALAVHRFGVPGGTATADGAEAGGDPTHPAAVPLAGHPDDGREPGAAFDRVGVAAADQPVGEHPVSALGEHGSNT